VWQAQLAFRLSATKSDFVFQPLARPPPPLPDVKDSHSHTPLVLKSSGTRPLYVHLCPRITTSGAARKSFAADTVAPACLRRCRTLCTSLRCSQMKRCIPLLLGMVLYPPSGVLKCVAGPRMAVSSRKGFATSGILGSRRKVTSPWKIATAFVDPWGSTVHL
jgi:hypothetical protein